MKRILKICCMVLLVVLLNAFRNQASAQEASVSYQTFYDDLSPYGQWIDNPDYGYVWHPDVSDFRPYSSSGHWVWTDDYGWMWASEYDWGWAPFHYGRWVSDDAYGWMWVPGYEWSPAWVEWRTGGDYYGWAPLGPGIEVGLNFSIGRYSAPYNSWCFVPRNYILSSRVYDYCVPQSRNTIIINNTTVINNFRRSRNVFVTGPERNEVERYTGRVNPFVLRESRNPGRTQIGGNTVSVFRPRVQKNEDRHFAPRNFEKYNRQNGNAFQQRNRDIVNGNEERRNGTERRESQNSQQGNNENAFQRRQQDANNQNEERRQQEQRNIGQQQQENRNAFERRQNEMRQQNEARQHQQQGNNDQQRKNMTEQRQNEVRQQQQQSNNDQQRRNMMEQRQNEAKRQQQQNNNDQQRRNAFEQRQNEGRQQQQQRNNGEQRQNQMREQQQQQKNNSFQQRQQQQNNGSRNGNGRGHDKHD